MRHRGLPRAINTRMKILGIDYSFTCPALCLTDGVTHRWWVHYKLHGKPYQPLPEVEWAISTVDTEVQRYLELAAWVVSVVTITQPDAIVLEDYAFGGKGRITQLSENAGVLKGQLFQQMPTIPLHVVAPTTMKKFATGSGRADKDIIWASFIQKEPTRKDWHERCHPKAKKITSPAADIADSYFLAHYGLEHFHG